MVHNLVSLKNQGRGGNGIETHAFFCDGSGNGRALHFTLRVDYNTSVVLEIEEATIPSAPGLALTDDNDGHR